LITVLKLINAQWKFYWQQPAFKFRFIGLFTATIIVLLCLPSFFSLIEAREGIVLNDWLLKQLPAKDFSLPIFFCIWSTGFLITFRSLQNPKIALQFITGFLLLTLFRIITISLVPLNAPIGLIPVVDPLSSFFYPDKFITKDLFFSGHTSTQILMFLTLQKKADKFFAFCSSVIVAVLVLWQHIHYTIDVVAAVPCSYFVYKLAKKIKEPIQ
jgi:PAP2 superfamily C-terminal